MLLSELSLEQEILIAGTVKKLNLAGGHHYDTVEVELAYHDTPGSLKKISIDPDNIGDDTANVAANAVLLARWEAIGTACSMSLAELEAAGIVVAGETGIVTITPD